MTTPTIDDPLAGIDQNTSRDEMMRTLRQLAARLRRQESRGIAERHQKLTEIEARLRAKFGGRQDESQLRQAIISASDQEWREGIEFLEEFEELLPTLLQRVLIGGQALLGFVPTENGATGTTPA